MVVRRDIRKIDDVFCCGRSYPFIPHLISFQTQSQTFRLVSHTKRCERQQYKRYMLHSLFSGFKCYTCIMEFTNVNYLFTRIWWTTFVRIKYRRELSVVIAAFHIKKMSIPTPGTYYNLNRVLHQFFFCLFTQFKF